MNSNTKQRVILADDHPSVRSALALILQTRLAIDIVGEASQAEEMLACICSKQPDCLFLDWELPGLSAVQLSALHEEYESMQIIVLSARPEARQAAYQAGAALFLCKTSSPEEVIHVLKTRTNFQERSDV